MMRVRAVWFAILGSLIMGTGQVIEKIPASVDLTQGWLVNYWSEKLGVSRERLTQAVGLVGSKIPKVQKYLADGYRIAIRDEDGVARLVVKISLEKGGFGVSVPYHPAKQGHIVELPLRYDKAKFFVPLNEGKNYTVDGTVKLSVHMSGFVQFSRGGKEPIVSGYNEEIGQIKGAGVTNSKPINVASGPLCGVILQGLSHFDLMKEKPAEVFDQDDLWHHLDFSSPADTAYHLEMFMFPRSLIGFARSEGGKRILQRRLPFSRSRLIFDFDLRVIELPHLPFFLGAILSHVCPDDKIESGFKISGPGCGRPGEAMRSISAYYPRLEFVPSLKPISLNYSPPE